MLVFLVTFVLALAFAALLTPVAMRLATRVGALDEANGAAIPRAGGPAIAGAVVCAVGILAAVSGLTRAMLQEQPLHLAAICAGAAAILAVGVADDIWRLSAKPKFAVEAVVAIGLYVVGVRAATVWTPYGIAQLGVVGGLLFTVVWIVGITNAFNLLDGIDGAAAGAAVFALLALFVAAVTLDQPLAGLVTVAFAGATIGFLPANFAPARVYLGDSGSLVLGFVLAALALEGTAKGPAMVAIAIPVVAFGLPVADTLFAVVRRAVRGAPLFRGDRGHLHHRLLDLGLSPRQAAVVLYAVSALFALASMLFLNPNVQGMAVVLTIVGVSVWLAIRYLHLHELDELSRLARSGLTQHRAIAFNVEVRDAAVALERCASWPELLDVLARLFAASEFDRVQLTLRSAAGERRREYRFEGGQAVETAPARSPDEWAIRLPFTVGPAAAARGELSLYRSYGRSRLLTDVNLLVATLCPALSGAAGRVSPPEL
jgi:UDP-GlcNAc:undecaprenyl-phosphate/decaprenyl-phosphate GlcNAc-1-phosphate transferase